MTDGVFTVFGGGGFVGRYVVQALLRSGVRVRVAERSIKRAWFLKAQANLGQIQFVSADVTQPESVARAVAGSHAVINLVGAFKALDAVQHVGAGTVAEAAKAAGVTSLVHMSAIGADADSSSAYGRSKGEGEAAVRAAFPDAVIMRPSIIFGREDQFVNRFAGLISALPIVPVIGGHAKFQPVFVADVAQAAVSALSGEHMGQTYELGGPEILTMLELNQKIAALVGREKLFLNLPDVVSGALAKLTGWLPGAPITRDQWLMLQADNVVSLDAKGLSKFGITPTPLDAVAARWLVQYRKHGRFGGKAAA